MSIELPVLSAPSQTHTPGESVELESSIEFRQRSTGAVPMAVVLGMSTTGLAALRLLGGSGVCCWGLDVDETLPGFRSRHCRRAVRLSHAATDEAIVAALENLADSANGRPLLIPTADRYVWLLQRHRSQLSSFQLMLPEATVIDDLVDKYQFTQRAGELGLPVPSTFAVANAVELPDRVAADSFPLIVRPRQRCTGEGAFPKAVVLRTQADAIDLAKTFRDRPHPALLVQEFIAGPTETQLSVAVLVNREHRAVATFTAKKIRQGQDEVGVGTYVESCCDREAEQLAVQFLERIRYVGVAEVEFKRHPGTGRLLALEVNPRLWEQVTLPAACGLNFPKMLLDIASGVPVEARATGRRPQGWQDLWDDFYWTFRTGGYWRTKRVSLAAWLWQTFTARGHAHLAWSDPLPAAARIRHVIRTLSRR